MAKAAGNKAATAKMPLASVTPTDPTQLMQKFVVKDSTSEEEILRQDSLPGVALEFDFVYFKKLNDDFVATLKAQTQKAYWLAFAEFADRDRRANIALHEVGVDPMTKILDRPKGSSNPLVRDEAKMQALLGREWHVSWKILGGEGDTIEGLKEIGFTVMRRPMNDEEAREKKPFEWSGEYWKIPDGTINPSSGEALQNVMVVIRESRWQATTCTRRTSSSSSRARRTSQGICWGGRSGCCRLTMTLTN